MKKKKNDLFFTKQMIWKMTFSSQNKWYEKPHPYSNVNSKSLGHDSFLISSYSKSWLSGRIEDWGNSKYSKNKNRLK